MYDIAILVFAAVAAIAAVVAALPPLGFDLRIIGRPKMPLEGIPYFRARQAWIAIVIAIISLAVSSGAFYYFFHPRTVEKIVEKPVEKIVEKMVPQECPKTIALQKSHSRGSPSESSTTPTPTTDIRQSNSGGINVQQATAGENSPIINSPITVGDVPKRISPADLTQITQYLSEAKPKSRIRVAVAQNSNAIPFANDIYKAFKDAGWAMDGDGVAEVLVFFPPGKKFQGVDITYKGPPIAPLEPVQVHAGEPLFPIGIVLKALKVPMGLKGDPDQKDADLITLQFEGLPD
jgi:hypothetical protein